MALEVERIESFRTGFGGVMLLPVDDGYDQARAVHNGLIDRRPGLIARCHGTADVVTALGLARDAGLEVAVRGGGHNVAGRAVCDDGLVIDLSPMKGIVVDPSKRTVLAQGGVTWGELNRETQLHGLAVTGGVISSTGIAGLTLGGGLGWLMGSQGMAVDNVLSIEVVLATGEVVRTSEDEQPDLFWAMRGGGGNFGIATTFEYRLHPVGPMVTGGLAAHPFARAAEVLRFYREITSELPDEQTLFAGLIHSPDGAERLAGIIGCHSGSLAEGEEAFRVIKEFGPPIVDEMGPIPYTTLNQMLDEGFPRGALNYWKSSFLQELSDEAIDVLIQQYEACPSPMSSLVLEHFHGAVTRVPITATAYPHRAEGYNLVIAAQWMDPAASEVNIRWCKETYEAMRPFMAPGRYVNYMPDDEAETAGGEAYGENLARLREVKRRYDPANLFHLNQNIMPA